MKGKWSAVAYAIPLLLIAYAVFPWIAPAYNHNLVLSIKFSTGSPPTYNVLLQNLAPWPVTMTGAEWLVTQNGIYNYWVPSEPPIQNLTLLPFQSHSFQFAIYNGTATAVDEYFNGTLTVDLKSTISVFGASSQVHIIAVYNAPD